MKITLSCLGKDHDLILADDVDGSCLISHAISLSRLPASRVRVCFWSNGPGSKRVPVSADQRVSELPSTSFHVRDLGPQFSYYGVFILEYLGPMLIWPVLKTYMRPERTLFVQLATIMWSVHFGKRLLETHFVHVFSRSTMPLFNLFKNCAYYWTFAGLVTWSVLRTPRVMVGTVHWIALGAFCVCETLNAYCHVTLRVLRPSGSTTHILPRGFLFDNITCPNYTMEILSWVSFTVFVRTIPALMFTVVGAGQMYLWAGQKKKRLVAEFPEANKRGTLTPVL